MLVLSRKVGQSLFVDGARLTIVRMDRGGVRISIDAPKSIAVDRAEIRERKLARRRAQAIAEAKRFV
jgi:carbon storage regulator